MIIIAVTRPCRAARSATATTPHQGVRSDAGVECPRAEFDAQRRLVNAEAAVGEIVNTAPSGGFEGYYRNEEALASKVRDGRSTTR